MSIGYSHQPLDERQLAALTARLRGRERRPASDWCRSDSRQYGSPARS